MLVLTRKQGDAIQIGEQIRVVVTQLKGNRVRIGISAPSDVTIRRSELPPTEVFCQPETSEQIPVYPNNLGHAF